MGTYGYICVPRELRSHWIWQQDKKLRMWLDLVMLASWDNIDVAIGNTIIKVSRGQYITSIRSISRIWGCCNQTASDFLKLLEQTNMIKREITPKMSIITIIDYEKYQPWTVQFSVQQTEQEKEKKNKEKKKINISNSREREIEFINLIDNDVSFFEEITLNLSVESNFIMQLYEKFKRDMMVKCKFHDSIDDYKQHFYNWARIITQNIENNNGKGRRKTSETGISSEDRYAARRGTDAMEHSADEFECPI